MSDVQDPNYMKAVVIPEDVAILPMPEPKLSLKEFASIDPGEDIMEVIDATNAARITKEQAHAVALQEVLESLSSVGLERVLQQLHIITADLTYRKVRRTTESLKNHQKLLEGLSVRSLFQQIALGLKASLADYETDMLKKIEIILLNSADRIAVRPLFHRAEYEVGSKDPPFTRQGLPRAISMPGGLDALAEFSAISEMCRDYPKKITEFIVD